MKDFPRIHSIGTVNIIHHQNFDYELHPFRTDFTGDSGVGKSILTDLLQLIIIGSTEYESSTNSQDDRPFNTLVIETSEKGDYGYAYINVEVEKEEYLLIGCYIERNSKQSQAFIVQSGLDFDQNTFEPFQKPFTVDDFVKDDTLLTLVDFDAQLNHSDHFGCHIYQYFRDYHEALLNNNLLPIDIANSKSALKDYAKILQAFSRKGISVKGDVKLQEFLFGKEKNQVFYNKYLDTVKQFEDSVAMHRTNRKDIEILTAKSESIKLLYELKKKKDASQREFTEVDWNYQKTVLKAKTKTIKKLVKDHLLAKTAIETLDELKNKKIAETNKKIIELQPKLDIARKESDGLSERLNRMNNCQTIKDKLSIKSNKQLSNVVVEYLNSQELDNALQQLKTALENAGLYTAFEKLDFNKGIQTIVDKQNAEISNLEQKLSLSKELVKFNDFDNPDTLSYWILKRNESCSPDEESVLRHFHNLKTVVPDFPKAGTKYIPEPQNLILKLKENQHTKDDDGFWLNLSGLNIYIEYVEQQIFDTNDNSRIKELLSESKKALEAEVKQIKEDISELKKLQSFLLNEVPNIPKAIPSWVAKNEKRLSKDVELAISEIAQENLEQIFRDLENEKQLREQHTMVNETKSKLENSLSVLDSIERQLPAIETVIIEPLSKENEKLIEDLGISRKQKSLKFSFKQDLYAVEYQQEYLKQKRILDSIAELDILLESKVNAENQILAIETTFSDWLPEFNSTNIEKTDFENSHRKFQSHTDAYSKQFEGILIGYHLRDKSEQFKDDKNFMELVRLLLPHQLFKEISFDEAAVIPKIIERLDEINESNARLNQNKLISIRDLLQDLQAAINKQVSHSKKMNSFFKKDYMAITGDNTASLKADLRKDISLQWISAFLINLGKLDFGLFDRDNSLTSKLQDSPTIEEKILLAYKEHSATPLPSVTIRQLLNPFSYYTLNYELVTKSGKKNSGSTGQTYSSIALLCIAKLSLIKDGKVNKNPGLRFLSIDEAEGIGSNFDMLRELAEEFDYQVISLGINPNKLNRKNQYIYRLSKRKDLERINHHPSVIFCEL